MPSQRIAITPGALGTPQASGVCVQGTGLGHVWLAMFGWPASSRLAFFFPLASEQQPRCFNPGNCLRQPAGCCPSSSCGGWHRCRPG